MGSSQSNYKSDIRMPLVERLCSLTLTRLVVTRPLGSDISSITVSVKMQGTKRVLRSNEIHLQPNGLLETDLELNFCIQYPHFLKREGNKLQIMLQRRKKYKNRTILGYKTIATGMINMSLVLQKQIDIELDLLSEDKESKGNLCARILVHGLNSQPVDSDLTSKQPLTAQIGRLENFSEDDEDYTSNEEASDSEPIVNQHRHKNNVPPTTARQRNLKQKFISLLKKFRLNEDLHHLDHEQSKLAGGDMDPADIEDLIDELELSDSGPELDTVSIISTPKPSLRPFFSSSKSLLNINEPTLNVPEKGFERLSDESSKRADSDSHPDSDPPLSTSSPPKFESFRKDMAEKEKKSRFLYRDKSTSLKKKPSVSSGSQNIHPVGGFENPDMPTSSDLPEQKQIMLEQISQLLPNDEWLPEHVFIVNTYDHLGKLVASNLLDQNYKVISTTAPGEVRIFIAFLINKIQAFCNNNSKPPAVLKLILVGADSFLNCILRNYVELLSTKPPDWQGYMRFLIVPLGISTVSRYLGTLDAVYNKSFVSETWQDAIEKEDTDEVVSRIQRYMQQSNATVHLPIAEAMLTCRERSSADDSSQIFIPFVSDVRLGSDEFMSGASLEIDDMGLCLAPSGSPPTGVHSDRKVSPPSSPNMNILMTSHKDSTETLELQVDYWLSPNRQCESRPDSGTKGKPENTKSTIKSAFRSLHVLRLGNIGELPSSHFTINYSTKEKNRKIMRLGKRKEKDREEQKNGFIDGVLRLICSPKAHNLPLKLSIDGAEWNGVKFFQLTSQWQTHIRLFPVLLFTCVDGFPL
ncbi:phosphofurin acidic cluster sorting protein 1 isoform X1 [Cimex lectularius]|uniref:Phosphofurin acidic cluster sorting protein 2 n=1 Tax=Cimex lectularius TaxID=79782 RepID=A0A8I6RYY6_CIMLE|nr:phosphofurin acidic cluster sorting protein 1 isoform X1 [Cimex lectularius]